MAMKRAFLFFFSIFFAGAAMAATLPTRHYQFLSDVYTIDTKYRSMEGPASLRKVQLQEGPPELLWITGVRTEMVEEDGSTPQLPELMCHVNVDLDPERHRAMFKLERNVATRLITLSQGITDTRVPAGFGFPIVSNEPLIVYTQVLNHNIDNPNLKVRHRVTFDYVRDRDLKRPMKPLMNLGASGMVLLDDNPLGIVPDTGAANGEHGPSCLIAARAPNASGMGSDYLDPKGRRMTGHWIVPPGRQVNHSDVTWFMGLPFDTRLHYAAVHLHPFAESLTLRDVTADKIIFTAKAKNPRGRVGLDHVDTFVSLKGVRLYTKHQYELISVYENPTEETHDSMASVFFGMADPHFVKPKPEELLERTANIEDLVPSDGAVVRTSAGDFAMRLALEKAPQTTKYFARLMRAGVVNGMKATRVSREGEATVVTFSASVTPEQSKLLRRLAVEKGFPHEGATFSFCASDAPDKTLTFDLVFGKAPARDGRCTAFASALTVAGSPALLQILRAEADDQGRPSVEIEINSGEPFQSDAPAAAAASM